MENVLVKNTKTTCKEIIDKNTYNSWATLTILCNNAATLKCTAFQKG